MNSTPDNYSDIRLRLPAGFEEEDLTEIRQRFPGVALDSGRVRVLTVCCDELTPRVREVYAWMFERFPAGQPLRKKNACRADPAPQLQALHGHVWH